MDTLAAPPAAADRALRCGPVEIGALGSEPLRVLGDHLEVRGPQGMVFVPPRGGQAADETESQLRVPGEDGAAIVLAATELYRSPGDDVEANIRRWLGPAADNIEEFGQNPGADLDGGGEGGLEVFFVTPPAPGDGDMVLIARAVVVSPDATVQHLAFFVAEAIIDEGGLGPCTDLARDVARALRPGGRRLETAGGRRVLRPGIAIELPRDYVTLERRGADFEVHYFYRLVALGERHRQLGIYFGFEPSTHVRDVLEMRAVAGAMLGQSVQWSAWTTAVDGERVHHMEAMVEVPGGEGLFAHAFFVAEDPPASAELKAVAETLSLFSAGAP